MLAGVSVDYYVRMERGSLGGASESVLDALADALQLEEAERDHLFALARASEGSRHASSPLRAAVASVPRPADPRRRDRRTGLDPQRSARHPRHEPPRPRALRPRARGPAPPGEHDPVRLPPTRAGRAELFVDYDQVARDAAAMLRLEAGRNPHDKALIELVGELSTQQRALPSALGLPGRPLPPERSQAAAPPRGRPARPRLRGPGAPVRTRPAAQRLHRRRRHPHRRTPSSCWPPGPRARRRSRTRPLPAARRRSAPRCRHRD